MDEGTLNDLLECSVCLERLDTTSKVLPCQHTFCRKCLEEIVQKHKELRCPECRVLVNIKIDSLPPNVLLMRILEGMKGGQGPKKAPTRQNRAHQHHAAQQMHTTMSQNVEQRLNNKHSNIITVPHQPYAKALYDYSPKEVGDLSFKRGDIIILKKRIDSHWYQGECKGVQGVFPLSYVQIITPVPSHIPQCKALYDFRMTNDEEEGCLSFNKGDIINVIRRVDENWAEGKLDGRIGIFPLAFVEMNNLARSLMKLSTNVQPGPSKVAPPTPTSEDSTPLIPTDHTATCIPQPPVTAIVSDSSSSTTTPNVSSSNTSSGSSTGPSSPASPPARSGHVSPRPRKRDLKNPVPSNEVQSSEVRQHNKEKRHSLTAIGTPQHNVSHRHSAEVNPSVKISSASSHRSERSGKSNRSLKEITLPAEFVALYPYKPQKPDEMELKKGGVYMVTEICQDGWYKGTSKHNQKSGVFPGNYVALAKTLPTSSSTQSKDGATADSKLPVSFTRANKNAAGTKGGVAMVPPELPPRSSSPASAAVSTSWHGSSAPAGHQLGRSSSANMTAAAANGQQQQLTLTKCDKPKDKKDKGSSGVSLMRRLASMKRSKSPPPSSYSMDNPVFEDVPGTGSTGAAVASPDHHVHVRSGSCPSQLLQIQPSDHRLFGSTSQRIKYKERPSILNHSARSMDNTVGSSGSSPDMQHRHKKSSSLDASNRSPKSGVQTVREKFRCIAPYPPNSEFELELQVNDIIYVHKKRDDGWYKGTQQRTGKTGLFPASFVESF